MPTPSALELVTAQKVPRLSASDHVAQTLKKAIVDGLLPAGELLRQDEIAAHFHVSKIPVREALKHLEAKGLVTFLRNRGVVVASLSAAEISEYMEIRALLEARAARLAAPLIGQPAIDEARQHLAEFARAADSRRWGELNWLFHSTLYAAAARPILLGEIRSLYNRVERYVRALLSVTTEMPKTRQEHAEILDAFVRRDPDAAAELTRAHVLDAGASLVTYLNDHRNQGGNR
ncbi:MAG: HTH-type transcriptional repressor RspR [Accumulibacter sp.]|uniref:GntR family transcriptional regulator n=1 Tax=Accumulibacter sp. TaxID=2053492 RepID=UPI00122B98EC|nr:GntR family transcriptional regulator [Accumulibacter sp.]QKS28773.1 MAG: GntR family transcriptional regulator [Candidatus Accumulibacter similis]TLD45898.1 MAG: HTH-type transcriptional repressor RspR [Accumulibacter sp.]